MKSDVPTFATVPVTEAGLAELISMHRLTELEISPVSHDRPEREQVTALWLEKVKQGREVRLMIDKGGSRWLILRDATGLMAYARVEGIIRFMLTEVSSSASGPTPLQRERQAAFGAWLRRTLGER